MDLAAYEKSVMDKVVNVISWVNLRHLRCFGQEVFLIQICVCTDLVYVMVVVSC